MPTTIDDLNNIPIKFTNGATVFLKDVGQVHDGSAVQQNIVRERRPALRPAERHQERQCLDARRRERRPRRSSRSPARRHRPGSASMSCSINRSWSPSSVASVIREGTIAAGLTGLMILLFLGSWRSTLIVMISIPLSILTSIVVLYFIGHTLNTMTLGGLALAVGILVDDSTVTIENTHRLLTEEGMTLPAGDAARLCWHCRADDGLDACHQLRVHLGRLPRGTCKVSVHAASGLRSCSRCWRPTPCRGR